MAHFLFFVVQTRSVINTTVAALVSPSEPRAGVRPRNVTCDWRSNSLSKRGDEAVSRSSMPHRYLESSRDARYVH